MADLIIFAAFLSFILFLGIVQYRNLAAIAGWCCIVMNLWSELPSFLAEDNFLYPLLALLAIPFLLVTAERLIHEDPAVLRLSRTTAVATIIWVPFALVPPLGNGLISLAVMLVLPVITLLGHHPQLFAWDVIAENGFYNQIILGCTGILVIALLLGFVFGERDLSVMQSLAAVMLIVPVLFFLNLIRVAMVFIAVSDHWFAGFPDPTGTGDANFFWAHNVIAEGLSIGFLLLLIRLLILVIPSLGAAISGVIHAYRIAIHQSLKLGNGNP